MWSQELGSDSGITYIKVTYIVKEKYLSNGEETVACVNTTTEHKETQLMKVSFLFAFFVINNDWYQILVLF